MRNQYIVSGLTCSMFSGGETLPSIPKCRVELGVQLEASIRPETIWELSREKNFMLPGDGSLKALKEGLCLSSASDTDDFLEIHRTIISPFLGDLSAIERMALEFVEDKANLGVAYCEAKFCPHLFYPAVQDQIYPHSNGINGHVNTNDHNSEAVTTNSILEAALKGFQKGEEKYETKVKLLMFCLWEKSEWAWDLLRLCQEYKNRGVVGLALGTSKKLSDNENKVAGTRFQEVFSCAKDKGIPLTVQIYRSDKEQLEKVLDLYEASRISNVCGIVNNDDLLLKCIDRKVHLEMAPYSSILRFSDCSKLSKRSSIVRLVESGAKFTVNSDCPTLTGKTLDDEIELVRNWGLNEAHLIKMSFQAVIHSFLNQNEKKELIWHLKEAYGILDYVPAIESASSSPPRPRSPNKSSSKMAFRIASWEDRH